jgi:hypothetical protein
MTKPTPKGWIKLTDCTYVRISAIATVLDRRDGIGNCRVQLMGTDVSHWTRMTMDEVLELINQEDSDVTEN